MRIAQVAPLWFEVPPQTYGGSTLIASLVTEELVKRGHEVTLFATADSKTKAKLIPIWPTGVYKDVGVWYTYAVFALLCKELLERQDEFDIIHDHWEYSTAPFSKFFRPPIVSTIHSPLTEENTIIYKKFPNVHYVAISDNQKKSAPGLHIAKRIYNGIDIARYRFNARPKDYLLWLSLIAPDKGLSDAIEIAKLAGEKLVIAGPIFPRSADYFEYRIKPLIDGKQIQFVGVADFKKKVRLLREAKGLLFPIFQRQEPFGLVVIEAMACGTPVIAARSGAMPELIKDGETGFLVDTKEEAVRALKNLHAISRQRCREHVVENFSMQTMVDNYEQLYKKILHQKK